MVVEKTINKRPASKLIASEFFQNKFLNNKLFKDDLLIYLKTCYWIKHLLA